MLQRLITLTVWILVGWTATSLLLRLLPTGPQAPAGAQALGPEAPPSPDWARLFGAAPPAALAVQAPPPPESSRFQLLGVVAAKDPGQQSRQGVALLAVDGAPPKSFRVGQVVDGELRLLAVEPRAVSVGRTGAAAFQLQLPAPPAAAVGILPSAPGLATPPSGLATGAPPPSAPPMLPALPVRSTPLPVGVDQPVGYPGAPGQSAVPVTDVSPPPPATEDSGPRRRRTLESR